MASSCYMLTVVALVFSGRFQKWESRANNVTEPLSGSDTVCNTSECIATASKMSEKMNLSADPCQDFSEFACGRYMREQQIPAGKAHISTMEDLKELNKLILLDILNNTNASQPEYMNKIRLFYRSCMNEDQIEAVGLTPYFNDSRFVNEWPTLNPRWISSRFFLNRTISRYMEVFVNPIVGLFVDNDLKDSGRNVIYLNDGSLGIEAGDLKEERNNSKVRAYETYLVEFAVALNASRQVAVEDARGVVDLEIMLSKIMTPIAQRYDFTKLYHPLKLGQFSYLYPGLDIASAIRGVFRTANIGLGDGVKVINLFPAYIKNLNLIAECFSKRTMQNLFGFKYALKRLQGLTRRLREIKLDFDRVNLGTETAIPRWKHCVDTTSQFFWQGMSKQFVGRHFSEAAKNKANQMIDELKEEFRLMVAQASWMSSSAKEEAYRKITAMKGKIGYPNVNFDDEYIHRIYEHLNLNEENYYNNLQIAGQMKELQDSDLASIKQPPYNNRWYLPPHDVDAYTMLFENEIVFLAGLMQAPFYSESFPDYLNYGALGSVVGHEITHHFDSSGMNHDAMGNLRNWWTSADEESFLNKSSCFVNQYSSFIIDELNTAVSGETTLIETMADIGGIKESFRAYKQHVRRHGLQPRLPILNLSQDQLFFLSYAQMYCEKMTPERLSIQLMQPHPPGKFRIIGALQNSEDFARVYNCSGGSYMNPQPKCMLW